MKSLFTFFLIITVLSVSAQDGVIVKYFDSLWESSSKENAVYYTHFIKEDTLYKCTSYYAKSNELYGKSTYTNMLFSCGEARGLERLYYQNGNLKDSTIYDNSGHFITHYEFYEDGKIEFITDSINGVGRRYLSYYPNNNLKDSALVCTLIKRVYLYTYSESGHCDSIAKCNKDSSKLVLTCFNKDNKVVHTQYKIIQAPASFQGGSSAWGQYLNSHLNKKLPADNGAPKGVYIIVVVFSIEKDGSISEATAQNNLGFGASEEAVRIISSSPKWIPAQENCLPVKCKNKQQITFVVN